MSNEKFVPHKNVPGAVRLKLERADNSGTVNSDPMFMVDRQAIINHVMAYSYLIDEGRWDDWFALFSDDVEASNSTPELGTVITRGSDTAFTWTLGGGADYPFTPHWSARGNLDFMRTHFAAAGQIRLRFVLGIAYTFGSREK